MADRNKELRKVWEKYMKDRFTRLYKTQFNPAIHKLRDDGSVVWYNNTEYPRYCEDVGVDYRTFKLKYRTTGAMPVPFKLEEVAED